jgi:hypothetical protein
MLKLIRAWKLMGRLRRVRDADGSAAFASAVAVGAAVFLLVFRCRMISRHILSLCFFASCFYVFVTMCVAVGAAVFLSAHILACLFSAVAATDPDYNWLVHRTHTHTHTHTHTRTRTRTHKESHFIYTYAGALCIG